MFPSLGKLCFIVKRFERILSQVFQLFLVKFDIKLNYRISFLAIFFLEFGELPFSTTDVARLLELVIICKCFRSSLQSFRPQLYTLNAVPRLLNFQYFCS